MAQRRITRATYVSDSSSSSSPEQPIRLRRITARRSTYTLDSSSSSSSEEPIRPTKRRRDSTYTAKSLTSSPKAQNPTPTPQPQDTSPSTSQTTNQETASPPTPTTPSSNFLLKIRLCKTTAPTVERILSIPADLQFAELHIAIATAFNWNETADPYTSWIFTGNENDACEQHEQPKPHKNPIYYTNSTSSYGIQPAAQNTSCHVDAMFPRSPHCGRYWTYSYGIARLHHAIEVVCTLDNGVKGKLCCLGGQGHIERTAWQFGDMVGRSEAGARGKSSWDFDMGKVDVWMKVVQDSYERRKRDETEVGTRAIKEEGE